MSRRLVVAWYQEDVSWLSDIPKDMPVSLYYKGGNGIMDRPLPFEHDPSHITVAPLPNVGREADTFLFHICSNYYNLEDWTYFVQGDPADHMHKIQRQRDIFCKCMFSEPPRNGPILTDFTLEIIPPVFNERLNVHERSKLLFGNAINLIVYGFSAGAQYIVSKDAIHRHSLESWERLRAALLRDDINAWELERLWPLIFWCAAVRCEMYTNETYHEEYTLSLPSVAPPPVTSSFGWLDRFPEHEFVIGPIQRSEAIMLYGLIKTLRPRRVIELGFYKGDSCSVLCAATATDPNATVESYDINWVDEGAKNALKAQYPHLSVELCDQRLVMDRTITDNRLVDFLFLDASHDFEINKATWATFLPRFSSNAVVMVHDTGLWVDEHCPDGLSRHGQYGHKHGHNGRFHQPDEVLFVKWITSTYPNWRRMDFMSVNTFRHGFTLLQQNN